MLNENLIKVILADDNDQIVKLIVAKNTTDDGVEIEIREESEQDA
jgi:hypothetical protein